MQRIRSFAFSFGRVRDRRQFAILRRECASERSERSAVESREFTLKRCVGGEADYTYSSRNSVVIPYKFSSFENPHNGEKAVERALRRRSLPCRLKEKMKEGNLYENDFSLD